MPESNQEGYLTLGWIINQSEQGLFLAVADEEIQQEIVKIYRRGTVEIYDYKQRPGAYSFRELNEWITSKPDIRTFLIVNLQLAMQNDADLQRLNFSRDMLENLGKNLVFCTTPYGDSQLVKEACDFYSYMKLRMEFHPYEEGEEEPEKEQMEGQSFSEKEWTKKEAKQKWKEACDLLVQARIKREKAQYEESEKLLLKAQEIVAGLLGPEHLEMAAIESGLAHVYREQGKYQKAEGFLKKALSIREKALGEEHPDTATSYNDIADIYSEQGRYQEAEVLCRKALLIKEKVLGENHADTSLCYSNLGKR